MPTVIDRLIATLSLDGAAFQRGIAQAQAQAGQFGSSIGSNLKGQIAGAFSVAAVTAFGKSIIKAASDIQDLADRLDLSTDAVQKLEGAGRMVGVPLQATEQAFTKLLDNLQSGAKGVPEALDAIGMSLGEVQRMDFDTAVNEISKGLSGIEDSGKRAEAALALFGSRGGLKALQVLQEMGNQKPIFSKEQLATIDKIGDDLSAAFRATQAGAASILEKIVAHPAQLIGAMSVHGLNWDAISKTLEDVRNPKPNPRSPIGGGDAAAEAYAAKLDKAREWMAIQDEILKLEEDSAKNFENVRTSQLTDEERRNELLQERLRLMQQLNTLDPSSVEAARAINAVSNIDTDLVRLQTNDAVRTPSFGGSFSSDNLTAIGGFTGSGGSIQSVSDKLTELVGTMRRIELLMDGQGIKLRKL